MVEIFPQRTIVKAIKFLDTRIRDFYVIVTFIIPFCSYGIITIQSSALLHKYYNDTEYFRIF